jgi:chorismate mutase-like protein
MISVHLCPSAVLFFSLGLFAAVFFCACSTPPLPEESVPVVALMGERLSLARDVAWAKWTAGLPVRDPASEDEAVKKLVRQGESADLEEGVVLRFVRAQIEASYLEQEAWMKRWREGEPLPAGDPPALEALRLRLDRMSTFLLAEYAGAWETPPAAARARLKKSVIDPRSASVAASAFVGK